MLYLDTTAAARSPTTCGIPRTVRRLYEALRQLGPITPVAWSQRRGAYCALVGHEQRFLEKPFARHVRPSADPSAVGRRWRYSVARWLCPGTVVLRGDETDERGHTLLMPDIVEADRAAWLEKAAAAKRLRLVGLFHDAIPFLRPDLTPSFRQTDFGDYVRCMAKCDELIAVSAESRESVLAAWRQFGCQPAPVEVEPWPMEFGPHGSAEPTRFAERRVLYVSSLDARKNHLALFAASEQLWAEGLSFELTLIGRRLRVRRHSQPILEAINALQRRGRPLHWLQHVSDDALVDAYRRCSFTVYPSLIEGFGLPIQESLWFGRPCVCGTNGALGEVSAGGGCLPCDQANTASLATAMRQLLTDRALYERLAGEAERRPFRSWIEYARALRSRLAV